MSQRLVSLGKRTETPVRRQPAPGAPRVFVETYGCQMNVADSDLIGSVLADAGYAHAARADEADVIVVNTCAVREKAEERVIARARELGALKRKRPGTVLAIVGCMAEHLKEGLAERAPAVDVIAGPTATAACPSCSRRARARARAPLVDIKLDKAETYEGCRARRRRRRLGLRHDPARLRQVLHVLRRAVHARRERGARRARSCARCASSSTPAIARSTLLGQTVNSYAGRTSRSRSCCARSRRVDGIERVRFTSPYPVDFTDDVIAAIAEEPKVCKYVHLPVQSGSTSCSSACARLHRRDYRAIVAACARRCPTSRCRPTS
jgi:tRNA-2-methylthio-N6-dimethylallyladenosine synthase